MKTFQSKRIYDSCSDKRKSKIENPKWLGHLIFALVLVVFGAVVRAQQPTNVPRIGFVTAGSRSTIAARIEAFQQGLRDLAYTEDKNIVIEWRSLKENQIEFRTSSLNWCVSKLI
jgi:hypothetical protein